MYSMVAGRLDIREDVDESRRQAKVEAHSPAESRHEGWIEGDRRPAGRADTPGAQGHDDRNMRGGGTPYAEPKLVDLYDLARSPTGISASRHQGPWHS